MTLALIGKTKKRRSALLLAAFFAIIVSTLGGLALRDSANAVKPPDADPVGTIQVHKYVPKDNVNTPWQNEANVSFQFAVYDNAALTGTPLATFDQLGQPAKDLPQDKSLWLTELAKAGYTQNGYWIPDADNTSGNDKCVDPTSAILPWPLQITTEMWTTKGNQDGLFHVCAYNSPEPTERTIRIGKVTTTAAHPGVSFNGTYTGGTFNLLLAKDTLVGTPVAKTVGTGSITVVETTIPAKWTLAGYALVSDPLGTAVCSPEADYSLTANTVPAGTGRYLVCILNEYNSGPILRSLAVEKVIVSATPDTAVSFGGTVTGGLTWETTHGVADLVSDSLQPGSYVISEDAEPGYTLTGFAVYYGEGTCPAAPVTTGSSATALLAGTNLTGTVCVYNEPQQINVTRSLSIEKVLLGTQPTTAVEFTGSVVGEGPWAVDNGDRVLFSDQLTAGSYEVNEDALTGYVRKGFAVVYGAEATCPTAPETTDASATAILTGDAVIATVCVYNEPEPVQVHIAKHLDGVHATATNAGSYAFPMTATWTKAGFANGTNVPYVLGPAGHGGSPAYEAYTALMNSGASFTTSETLGVCQAGQTYGLLGYTVSATAYDTNPGNITTTVPAFTGLETDQYIVVWNETCDSTLRVNKVVVAQPGIIEDGTFNLTVNGIVHAANVANGGTTGVLNLAAGTYTVGETQGSLTGEPLSSYSSSIACTDSFGATVANPVVLEPGDNVTCVITNTRNPVASAPKIIVRKWSDPAGNMTGTGGLVGGWPITIVGISGPANGQVFTATTGTTGVNQGIALFDGIPEGVYTVAEPASTAGWRVIGSTLNSGAADLDYLRDGAQAVPAHNGTSPTVDFYNQPLVTITANKIEVTDRVASAGQGWKITLSGCGFTDTKTTAGQDGSVTWTGIPACATYVVTEDTTSKPGLGFVAVTPTAVAVNATVAGQTYTVEFRNERNTYIPPVIIETPVPVVPTPTPVPPTPVPPTPVPPTVVPPTPVDDVAGEKVSPTPAPPAAGTGTAANEEFPIAIFVLGGLLLAGSTIALVATSRRTKSS